MGGGEKGREGKKEERRNKGRKGVVEIREEEGGGNSRGDLEKGLERGLFIK